MPIFRKKPVEVEARLLDYKDYDETVALVRWCDGVTVKDGIEIRTLEGTMLADEGDWIIRGVKGELYPCKPDIFEATYDYGSR